VARRNPATRQIEVQRPHDVDAGRRLEQPELRAQARVEVQELVLLIATVEPPVQVHDAAEPEPSAQVRGLRREPFVRHDAGVGGDSGVGWPGAVLHAGERDEALGRVVTVSVEDPVLRDRAWDVLLEHHRGGIGP